MKRKQNAQKGDEKKMTKAEIDTAINECQWKKDYICVLNSMPCQRAMEIGQCDTLVELFSKEDDKDD